MINEPHTGIYCASCGIEKRVANNWLMAQRLGRDTASGEFMLIGRLEMPPPEGWKTFCGESCLTREISVYMYEIAKQEKAKNGKEPEISR